MEVVYLLRGVTLETVTFVSAIKTAYLAWQLRKKLRARTEMTPALRAKFEKTLRVYKRAIAFYPFFLVILWTSGLFFRKEVAAGWGFVYNLARPLSSCGSSKFAKIMHFLMIYSTMLSILFLSLTGIRGLLNVILDPHIMSHCTTDINHFVNCLYGETQPYYSFF